MKKLTPVALVCTSMAVAAVAGAALVTVAPQPTVRAAAVAEVEGVITAADVTSQIFTLSVDEQPKPLRFSVNDKTTYTLDGAASTIEKVLVSGYHAKVTHEEEQMIASRVAATTPE